MSAFTCWSALLTVALSGASPDVPAKVTAYGFLPIGEASPIGQSAAQAQARANIAKLMDVDAIKFELDSDGPAHSVLRSTVSATVKGVDVVGAPHSPVYVALARYTRPAAVVQAMRQLDTVPVEVTVERAGMGLKRAYSVAETRTLRKAIAAALEKAGQKPSGHFTGSVTLTSMDVSFQGERVTISARAAVKIDQVAELDPGQRPTVLAATAAEDLEVGEYDEAVELLSKAVALSTRDPALWASLGEARMGQGDATRAADAFGRAAELDPKSRTPLERLLAALEKIPDERRASALKKKLEEFDKAAKK